MPPAAVGFHVALWAAFSGDDGGLPTAVHDILMQFDVLFNVSDGVNNLFGAQLVRVDSPVWSMSWSSGLA